MADDVYDAAGLATNAGETFNDVDGVDWLVLSGSYSDASTLDLRNAFSDGVATQAEAVIFHNGTTRTLWINGLIENVRGSDSRDWIRGNQVNNILYGDQSENGAGGIDTLRGEGGNDTIFGGSGNDDIDGQADDDLLYGNDGNDNIVGGEGVDVIEGGAGADTLDGGADAGDTVRYDSSDAGVSIALGTGYATVSGGHAQGDQVYGFTDVNGSAFGDVIRDALANSITNNLFSGEGGHDRLFLGGGNDTGLGGDGQDQISGQSGRDNLFGGAGGDSLTGGQASDFLVGGSGADRFIFTLASESTVAVAGRDRIDDFNRAQGDKIDLRGMDAKSGAGNQAFIFIGSQAFDGDKGDLRFVKAGTNVVVQGDINGDRKADFAILVEDMTSLRASDFLL
ncbi:calcium-binding protein [Neogemmobacter tilapiae]|uniref:Calcium-binding protein n=1 Tax=Neogemmobacter tilapiae TaxID=875041 RepID=A0A918TGE7_9RHOB|nr:calcium-binding protein [Gemmobacter tilapiae]GHC48045.1 hypothetical protein GCM10007315_07460 [Gemmobacter tilapiae]